MKIEACVKSVSVDEKAGEINIEFNDEQTEEEVECIKAWILDIYSATQNKEQDDE